MLTSPMNFALRTIWLGITLLSRATLDVVVRDERNAFTTVRHIAKISAHGL